MDIGIVATIATIVGVVCTMFGHYIGLFKFRRIVVGDMRKEILGEVDSRIENCKGYIEMERSIRKVNNIIEAYKVDIDHAVALVTEAHNMCSIDVRQRLELSQRTAKKTSDELKALNVGFGLLLEVIPMESEEKRTQIRNRWSSIRETLIEKDDGFTLPL